MVINNCKHDGGFMLTYDMLIHNYGWGCVRCQVYKLPFSPDEAGKQRTPDWWDKVIAYTKDPPEGKKTLPKIDYKAGEL